VTLHWSPALQQVARADWHIPFRYIVTLAGVCFRDLGYSVNDLPRSEGVAHFERELR
jgi:hypothetical protein